MNTDVTLTINFDLETIPNQSFAKLVQTFISENGKFNEVDFWIYLNKGNYLINRLKLKNG